MISCHTSGKDKKIPWKTAGFLKFNSNEIILIFGSKLTSYITSQKF